MTNRTGIGLDWIDEDEVRENSERLLIMRSCNDRDRIAGFSFSFCLYLMCLGFCKPRLDGSILFVYSSFCCILQKRLGGVVNGGGGGGMDLGDVAEFN